MLYFVSCELFPVFRLVAWTMFVCNHTHKSNQVFSFDSSVKLMIKVFNQKFLIIFIFFSWKFPLYAFLFLFSLLFHKFMQGMQLPIVLVDITGNKFNSIFYLFKNFDVKLQFLISTMFFFCVRVWYLLMSFLEFC